MSSPAEIAQAFKGSRDQFAALFDEVSTAHDGKRFKLIAREVLNNSAPYLAPLEYAESQGWLMLFKKKAIAAKLLDAGSELTSDFISATVQEQALANVNRGFFKLPEFNAALALAEKRLCKILVSLENGVSKGTGFLVGPQTVLTAWHVIDPLTEPDNKPSAKSAEKLKFEFDVSAIGDDSDLHYAAADDWLVAGSENPTAFSSDQDGLPKSSFLANPDKLDFALVRLKGTPGGTRGYYKINKDVWPEVGTPVIVCQHPAGHPQHIDVSDEISYLDEITKTRILHKANTLTGSSGGLCLNYKFQPVALHQFGLLDDAGEVIANGGVPIGHIAPSLQKAEDVDPLYSTLSYLTGGEQPIIGRAEFQAAVWEAELGNKPIMRVRGLQNSGKSFCVRILRAMLNGDENEFLEISAIAVPSTDTDFVEMVLHKVELPGNFVPLPNRDDAATSDHAWQEQELLQAFLSRLSSAMGNRTLWLIIEDLDHHTLPNSSTRSFLAFLYKHVKSVCCLRIVLVGLNVKVPGADIDLVHSEQTKSFKESEIANFLGHSFGSKDYSTNKDELGRISSIIRRGSQDPEDIPAVANYVRDVIIPALKL